MSDLMNFIDDESRHERFVAEARLWDCIKEQQKGDRYDFIAPDGDNINSPKRLLGSKHSINFQQEERVKKKPLWFKLDSYHRCTVQCWWTIPAEHVEYLR